MGGSLRWSQQHDLSSVILTWSQRWDWVREEKKREMGLKGCGSGIVEGGFARSVSSTAWERQIRDVRGQMGFADVRVGFALVDRVHAELEVGGGKVEWEKRRKGRKPIGVEGKTTALLIGVWVDLGPTSMCKVELCLPFVGAWGGVEELGELDYVEWRIPKMLWK